MPRLDKRTIATLPGPAAGRFDITHWDADLPGFGLRVLSSGRRSWLVRYRIGKRQRVVTLGTPAEVTPVEAREKARVILAGAELGHDAQAEIRSRKAEPSRPSVDTLGDVTALYLKHVVAHRRPRTQTERRRHLMRDWLPLHGRPIDQISRRDVASWLLRLKDDHGPVAANRARSSLNALFTWALQQGLAEINPVIGTALPGTERVRDRVLSTDELRAIWRATSDSGDYHTIVRLLMLTGQRREEIAAMRWSEIDSGRCVWTIPATRTKNRRPHEVPLSRQVLAVLQARPRRLGRDLVFGEGAGPFSGWSRAKARLNKRSGLAAWTLHDIRRSVVTGMVDVGLEPHVVEAVVNHVSGHKAGVAGIYNRATYAAEKRAALRLWADHLEGIVDLGLVASGAAV